ncbi:MAG: DUF4340 domain-containing protein [Planctomycetota bacterium]
MAFRHTLILLGVLAAVAGGYFLLQRVMTPAPVPAVDLYGGGRTSANAVGIHVIKEGAAVTVSYQGGRYWILNKATGAYSIPAREDQILTFFNGLNATRLIDRIPREGRPLEDWGFDGTATQLTLTFADGTTQVIRIGTDNRAGRGVFCLVGTDETAIHLLSIQVRHATEAVLFNLADDRIVLVRSEAILRFEIHGAAAPPFRANDLECVRVEGGGWQVRRPRTVMADGRAVRTYLDLLTGLRFDSLEDRLQALIRDREPLLEFTAYAAEGVSESIVFYKGAADMMESARYIMLNRRTGQIGYVYELVFNTVNRSFVSFVLRRLFEGDAAMVTAIRVERGDRVTSFQCQPSGAWTVVERFDAPVAPAMARLMLDLLRDFRVSDFVSDDVADIGRCGLQYPLTILTIEETVGGEETVSRCYYFGDQVPGRDEVYFKAVDANEIYTVRYDILRFLTRPARAFADRTVTGIDKARIDRVKITRADRSYKFYWSELEGWYLKEPLLTRHIAPDRFESLTAGLAGMVFEDMPSPETVPPDTFDDAVMEMKVEVHFKAPADLDPAKNFWPEPDQLFLFTVSSRTDKSGNVFVRHDLANMVFTVAPALVDLLRGEFVDRSVITGDIAGATGLVLEYPKRGLKVTLARAGDAWSHAGVPDARTDVPAVRTYLELLQAMRADSVFEYRSDEAGRSRMGFDAPVLVITILSAAGERRTVTVAGIRDEQGNALVQTDSEVYILQISSEQAGRLLVGPEFFLLQ